MKTLERKIGEHFTHGGVTYVTEETGLNASCKGCIFYDLDMECDELACSWYTRSDKKNVIHKKVDKL